MYPVRFFTIHSTQTDWLQTLQGATNYGRSVPFAQNLHYSEASKQTWNRKKLHLLYTTPDYQSGARLPLTHPEGMPATHAINVTLFSSFSFFFFHQIRNRELGLMTESCDNDCQTWISCTQHPLQLSNQSVRYFYSLWSQRAPPKRVSVLPKALTNAFPSSFLLS